MYIKNTEQIFSKDELYYCYDIKIKNFLCNLKNIQYIKKSKEEGKFYWIFLMSDELEIYLKEWNS